MAAIERVAKINGSDCSIVVKTQYREAAHFCSIPYTEETIREAYSFLNEEAAIEGDGVCGGIRKTCGVTGCVVTPLTMGSAPLLFYLAFGSAGFPVFVSETRNLYRCDVHLLPLEDCDRFMLVQDRGGERKQFNGCAVTAFELRFERGQSVKLKLDIAGNCPSDVYQGMGNGERGIGGIGERFSGDCVSYRINGVEHKNIYGLTLSTKKEGGTKTELRLKRNLQQAADLPGIIEELTVTAQLLRDRYERRVFGMFRITLKRLVLISDETTIDCADSVIGPLRYYAAGTVSAETFTTGEQL